MPRVLFGKAAILALCAAACSGFSAETSPDVPSWASVHAMDSAWNVPLGLSRAPLRTHRARLVNFSIRALRREGSILSGTAGIQGLGTLPVLVRAIGPGLEQFGVANAAGGVWVRVVRDGRTVAASNFVPPDTVAAAASLGAFPLFRANNLGEGDSAVGGRAVAGTLRAECNPFWRSGVGMLEFYDASADPALSFARFSQFSAETVVAPGDGVLVLGFVVLGEGEIRLMLRALGPRPPPTGPQVVVVPSDGRDAPPRPSADPAIELYRGSTLIAENDSWHSAELPATDVREAAAMLGAPIGDDANAGLVVTLRAGAYTLQVRDHTGGVGPVLAEIAELPPVASTVAQPGTGTSPSGTVVRDFDPADSANALGLDIYRRAATANTSNLAISPYSIQTALALTYTGAAGLTRREMGEVLRFPDDNLVLQAGLATVRDAMLAAVEDSRKEANSRTANGKPTRPIEWHTANRLYGQSGYGFRDTFLTLLRDGFSAPLVEVDFRTQFEPARLAINAWVLQETRQKIADLIPAGGIDPSTLLVLVNAIYLNAPWQAPFKPENTMPRPFHLTRDTSVDVPTMAGTMPGCYSEEDGFTLVGLNYLANGLRFLILLPDENQMLDTVAGRLTPAHFARWARMSGDSIRPYLPKFKIAGGTIQLRAILRAMGMNAAFDVPAGTANFDGMAPQTTLGRLSIGDVFHKAFIALDEEGTEAAAATAVVVIPTSAELPPIEVHVDRPFLFAIQHRGTGTCLFLGRINDPR